MSCKINKCENDLCIYSKKNQCILKNTSINELGYCDSFILVSLPFALVEIYKEKNLEQYSNYEF